MGTTLHLVLQLSAGFILHLCSHLEAHLVPVYCQGSCGLRLWFLWREITLVIDCSYLAPKIKSYLPLLKAPDRVMNNYELYQFKCRCYCYSVRFPWLHPLSFPLHQNGNWRGKRKRKEKRVGGGGGGSRAEFEPVSPSLALSLDSITTWSHHFLWQQIHRNPSK